MDLSLQITTKQMSTIETSLDFDFTNLSSKMTLIRFESLVVHEKSLINFISRMLSLFALNE